MFVTGINTFTTGQHLMDLYSPELATPEQELLFLLKNDPSNSSLIAAARQRLLLLGVSAEQLAEVERSGRASATLGVYSNYTGHIHEAGNTMPTADSPTEIFRHVAGTPDKRRHVCGERAAGLPGIQYQPELGIVKAVPGRCRVGAEGRCRAGGAGDGTG